MMKWNKFTTRPMTEEEREFFSEDVTFIWEAPVPDIDEEVLVSDGKTIWTDTWVDIGLDSVGLDGTTDAEGLYWMELPELPKEGEE